MQAIFSNVHRECNVRNDAAQAGAGMMMWFISSSAFANEIRFNMTRGATAISQQVYDLHMTIFYICCVIGLLVFGIMFWSIVHHRKSRGAKAAQFHESTRIELLWTVIPVLILIAGGTGNLDPVEDGGYLQGRSHRPRHGLAMEMALQIPRVSSGVLFPAGDQQTADLR